MRVLLTHAGRHGDALWSLATVRAVAETVGEPVDFCLSAKYGRLAPLIQEQDYIRQCWVDPQWDVRETAPISPAEPPGEEGRMLSREVSPLEPPLGKLLHYEKVIHLSFRGWPTSHTLAEGYWENVKEGMPELRELEVERPWIQVSGKGRKPLPGSITAAFSDEWFELKFGILHLVQEELHTRVVAAPGSRWVREAGYHGTAWMELAHLLQGSEIFFGCLSAPWVLANAMGKRCVIVEPAEARWHPVFWMDSPRNVLVRGADGKPSFDARHAMDELKKAVAVGREA